MDTSCVLIVLNTSSPRLNLQYCTKETKAKFADFRPLFRENSKKNRHEILLKRPRIFVESKRNLAVILAKFRIHRSEFRFAEILPEILKYWWSIKYWWLMKYWWSIKLYFLKLSTKMMIFSSTITILVRNNWTAAAVAFSFRQTKLLKAFVQLWILFLFKIIL